jgi:hypothetical protein
LLSAVHRIGPHAQDRPSFVQVDLSFERSIRSRLARREIDSVELIIVNVPVAPANRPVPFSIVATLVIAGGIWWMKTP